MIKTDEQRLTIIQNANGIFSKGEELRWEGIEFVEGFDEKRLCEYKVFACGEFYLDGVSTPIKVARVEEYYPKREGSKKQAHVLFYVLVTNGEDLSALQLRELGHIRWAIENNGFKELNKLVHTKRVFTHDGHSFLATLLIFFVAYNLILLFFAAVDKAWIYSRFGGVKVTIPFLCLLLFFSLIIEYGMSDTLR